MPRIDIDDYWVQATYAEADTYFTARGNSGWMGENALKTQALQRAWDYMKTLPWKDDVFSLAQPDDIKQAQILLALEELLDEGVLTPALTRDDYIGSKNIAGAVVKTYRKDAPIRKKFSGAEMLLAPYLHGINTSSVVRA